MKPRIEELDDGTLVAFLDRNGQLTTKDRAVSAVLTYSDGSREVAIKSSTTNPAATATTIREG